MKKAVRADTVVYTMPCTTWWYRFGFKNDKLLSLSLFNVATDAR